MRPKKPQGSTSQISHSSKIFVQGSIMRCHLIHVDATWGKREEAGEENRVREGDSVVKEKKASEK